MKGNNKKTYGLFQVAVYTWVGSIFIFALILLQILLARNSNWELFLKSPTRTFSVVLMFADIAIGSFAFLIIFLYLLGKIFKKIGISKRNKSEFQVSAKSLILGVILLVSVIIIATFYVHDMKLLDNSSQPVQSETRCVRTVSYEMPPEFSRAISFINQRAQRDPNYVIGEYQNCLNIQYGNLKQSKEGPEGIFLFDSSISTPNTLVIIVDNSYRGYDDLLTSTLLVHELTHAEQYYFSIVKGLRGQDCIEKEVEAFYNQFFFLVGLLNQEERESIIYRSFGKELTNPALIIQNQLLTIFGNSFIACQKVTACANERTRVQIKNMVQENPYYREQCKLN